MKNLLLKFLRWRLKVASRKFDQAVLDWKTDQKTYEAVQHAAKVHGTVQQRIKDMERRHAARTHRA